MRVGQAMMLVGGIAMGVGTWRSFVGGLAKRR